MATLALAMIARNEQETIERVLGCARSFCDELIVLDTGSTDQTVELARAMGARVLHFDWVDDFAVARNEAFSHSTSDWTLWLDADDVLTESDQQRLRELKATLDDTLDGVFCTYQLAFDADGLCTYSTPRERLIRRAAGLHWEYPVHECIAIPLGRSLDRLDIGIAHRPLETKLAAKSGRNLAILGRAVSTPEGRVPRNLFYYANELRDHTRWDEAVVAYQDYLPLSDVWWEKYAALLSLARCHLALDQPEPALQYATEAMLLDPERAEAWMELGFHYFNKGIWSQALPFFHAASTLKMPSAGFHDNAAYTWQPHDYIGVCYSHLGRYPEAVGKMLDAMASNPDKPRLLKNLHWMVDQL